MWANAGPAGLAASRWFPTREDGGSLSPPLASLSQWPGCGDAEESQTFCGPVLGLGVPSSLSDWPKAAFPLTSRGVSGVVD